MYFKFVTKNITLNLLIFNIVTFVTFVINFCLIEKSKKVSNKKPLND